MWVARSNTSELILFPFGGLANPSSQSMSFPRGAQQVIDTHRPIRRLFGRVGGDVSALGGVEGVV